MVPLFSVCQGWALTEGCAATNTVRTVTATKPAIPVIHRRSFRPTPFHFMIHLAVQRLDPFGPTGNNPRRWGTAYTVLGSRFTL